MSLSGNYQLTVTALGITCIGGPAVNAITGLDPVDTTLAVGNAGTITDDVVTLTAGHTVVDGTVDVYWTAGKRYGCTANVAENSATLTGGAGDALPTGATAVVVANQTELDEVQFDGDDLNLIGMSSQQRVIVCFMDGATVKLAVELVGSSSGAGCWGWVAGVGITNPLAGYSITSITVSNGSSTVTSTFKLTGLQ